MVSQHLRAWNEYSEEKYQISFWGTRSGVEVKNTKRVDSKDCKPLEAFYDDYPEAKLLLLHRGDETYKINHVTCTPCEKFLQQLMPDATSKFLFQKDYDHEKK